LRPLVIASINLQAGLRTRRAALTRWLAAINADGVLLQDPGGISCSDAALDGYLVGHYSRRLAALWRPTLTVESRPQTEFWQENVLGWLSVHNIYLSPRSQSIRAGQLDTITRHLRRRGGSPAVVLGDFNIAPRAEDGLYGEQVSHFNGVRDRSALNRFLTAAHLTDLGARIDPSPTIELSRNGSATRFRCDLVLAAHYMTHEMSVRVDHSTRRGPDQFSDHSGLIVTVPWTAPDSFSIPGNTAKGRKFPSWVARHVVPPMARQFAVKRILDFGCGRGEDVRYFTELGLDAVGYDAHMNHGFATRPEGRFDMVTVTYVLTTLPDPSQRLAALRDAVGMLRRGGHAIVTVRSIDSVEKDAAARGWARLNDGYCTSRRLGTFVKGMRGDELTTLMDICRLDVRALDLRHPDAGLVAVGRRR
jgi:2-polyprenyl-3-methyl-5-hydroxy-6-metoxy-1,4-benzoquinol methylase